METKGKDAGETMLGVEEPGNRQGVARGGGGVSGSRPRNHSVCLERRDALVIDVPIRRTHLLNCRDYWRRRRRRSPPGVLPEGGGHPPFQPTRYVIRGGE